MPDAHFPPHSVLPDLFPTMPPVPLRPIDLIFKPVVSEDNPTWQSSNSFHDPGMGMHQKKESTPMTKTNLKWNDAHQTRTVSECNVILSCLVALSGFADRIAVDGHPTMLSITASQLWAEPITEPCDWDSDRKAALKAEDNLHSRLNENGPHADINRSYSGKFNPTDSRRQ
jgi:hypothetical protein